MGLLPFFVRNALKRTLNSPLSTTAYIALEVASVNSTKLLIQTKLWRSYLTAVNYLQRKFESDQAIAEMDFEMLCYTQLTKMTLMQYKDSLYVRSSKVADVSA